MKICVINFSGNVGKTLVTAQVLQPRLNATVLSIESVNADASLDGVEVERILAHRFATLHDRMQTDGNVIVDVGASSVEDFLERMAAWRGSHEDFDLWVVPVVRSRKQQHDTINTLKALRAMGVPAQRVRVVFNWMEHRETIEDDFEVICALGNGEYFELRPEAKLMYNEVYDRIKGTGRTLGDVVRDDTDYKAMIRTATTQAERHNAAANLAIKRLAAGAQDNLDQVYAALTT